MQHASAKCMQIFYGRGKREFVEVNLPEGLIRMLKRCTIAAEPSSKLLAFFWCLYIFKSVVSLTCCNKRLEKASNRTVDILGFFLF